MNSWESSMIPSNKPNFGLHLCHIVLGPFNGWQWKIINRSHCYLKRRHYYYYCSGFVWKWISFSLIECCSNLHNKYREDNQKDYQKIIKTLSKHYQNIIKKNYQNIITTLSKHYQNTIKILSGRIRNLQSFPA